MATDAEKAEFLRTIVAKGKEIGVSLSHEDGHGAFLIEDYSDTLAEWLLEADYGQYRDLNRRP